mmetsp:Transcript_132651/g.330885  ORF Transcript_132651/g.330885 Transcript_132651/m.330885 type:complete len:213 (+) Transcript_132651:400-1038(+)
MERDRAGLIAIDLLEDGVELVHVLLLVREHSLSHQVLVVTRALDRILAEDAGQDIQYGQLRETNIGQEHEHPDRRYQTQRLRSILPTDAASDGLEEGEHTSREGLPIKHHGVLCFQVRGKKVQAIPIRSLGKYYAEQIDDHDHQNERPNQRSRCGHDLIHQHAQCSQEPHDTNHADDLEQAGDADDAQGSELVGARRSPVAARLRHDHDVHA